MKDAGELLPLEKAQHLLGLKLDPDTSLTPMEEDVAWLRMVGERDGIATVVCRRTGCGEDGAQEMIEYIHDLMCDGMGRTAPGVVDMIGAPAGQATQKTAVVEAVLMADPVYRLEGGIAYRMKVEN